MNLNEPADRCCAVVVGIEKYDVGSAWTLQGPAADALRFVAWLARHKMPASKMRVFLSFAEDRLPLSVDGVTLRDKGSGFQIELPGGTTIAVEPATQERIRRALIDPGWAPSTRALILFWGGHGVLRDTSDERYLYCANARKGDETAINITEQLRYLRSTQFNEWRQQVVFIDACAELVSARRKAIPTQSLPETDYQLNPGIEQWVLHAAAIGELAINLRNEGTGKFSKALFELFGATGIEALPVSSSGWPNFGTVAERMEKGFEGGTQCPVLFIADQEGVRRTVNGRSVMFRQEQGLINLLNSLPSVDLDRVQRVYRMVFVHVPEPPSMPDSTGSVIQVLASFAQVEIGLNLLERFVAKLYLLVAAGGHVGDGAKLRDWLEHHVQDQPALRAFLDHEAAAPGTVAHLLIDVPPTNSALPVRAWLFRPIQVIATWSGVPTGTPDLATSLGAALNWAITLYGEDELVVELMVPRELLDAGLDRETVPLPPEEGMGDEKRTLGVDYVTYLRLRERGLGLAPRLTATWKRAAQRVFAGFRQVGPFDVCWMTISDGVCHVDLSSESPWIGLTCAARSTKVSPRPLDAVLSRGAPLVVWPVKDPSDETGFRRRVEMLLRPTNLDALPATLKATMKGKAPDFTLMVDTPDRLPPERLDGDPTQRTSV